MAIPINGYDREEHDGGVNAKNVSLVKSTATLYAVVNTAAVGVTNSLATILNPVAIAGNITIDSGNVSFAGNITIDSGTVSVDSNTAWSDPNTYIGLATVDIGSAPTLTVDATGQGDVPVTLDGESVTASIVGNVTVDQVDVVTTVTAVTDITNPVALKGNLTIDSGTVSVDSNTAWSDPNTYIGLATVDIGSAPTLTVDATGQGDVPITLDGEQVTATLVGNVTIESGISGIGDGVKTVTSAGTDEALAGSTPCKKVDIQAQTDNTGLIAVGATGVDATEATGTGIILYAGDSYSLEIDNLADVYIDATVNGEGVRFTYYT